jgi:hypothetical protein
MGEMDFRDPNGPKQPAVPVFFTEAVKMEFKSKQAGRPVFEDREMVRIIIPGDRRSMVVEIVNDEHRQRWPKEYEAFTAGQEAPLDGTALADWPQISRARVEELAFFHIRTVEQLAALGDDKLQNLGMGAREERERAKVFLDVAKNGTAPLSRLLSRVEQAEADVARLTRDLTAANAEIAALKGAAGKEKSHG